MKKILLTITLFTVMPVYAEYSYVSPETYAINEADMVDYMNIPPSPKLKIDELDKKIKPAKHATQKPQKIKNSKPYEDTIKYKAAKWWVDQRYKREEEHHGTKHEIKVKAREEYEKQLKEKTN